MSHFQYSALNPTGKSVTGVVEATDISAAATELRSQSLTITNLELGESSKSAKGSGASMDFLAQLSHVSNNEVILFFRQLASLVGAGVTLVSAIRVLESQSIGRKMKFILRRIREDVEAGSAMSEALEHFPTVFPGKITSIVSAGELSGMMEEALERISNEMEESAEFQKQVISGLIYPSIVMVAALGVSAFLVGFVIPKMIPFLQANGGGKLPWNTQFLIDLSGWFKTNMHIVGAVLAGIVISIILLLKIPAGKNAIDNIKMHLPVFGPIFKLVAVVQFSGTVSILLESGIMMVESLKAAKETISNMPTRKVVDKMIQRVTAGETLSVPIANAPHIFPPLVSSLTKIGEETGNMGESLALVAQICKRTLQMRLRRITSLIEPLLTIFLAFVVGFIAWAMIAGMMSMYSKK